MRRPVKPFVTEYRGGSRRLPGQGQSPKSDPFDKFDLSGEPEPRAADPWPAPPPIVPYAASQQQEDSYEAALRAADSLFAGARPASPRSIGDESSAAHPSGGRVLRAVDEPPSHEMQEMLRLEAEFAPKKRGRKPGSKNKPKPAALSDDWAARPVAAEQPVTSAAAEARSAGSGAATLAIGTIAARAVVARTVGAGTVVAKKTVAAFVPEATSTGPRGERYAWVRTRLKPGQQWKRRLPKVAW